MLLSRADDHPRTGNRKQMVPRALATPLDCPPPDRLNQQRAFIQSRPPPLPLPPQTETFSFMFSVYYRHCTPPPDPTLPACATPSSPCSQPHPHPPLFACSRSRPGGPDVGESQHALWRFVCGAEIRLGVRTHLE